jgi:drug/metabolite transporter (DMT)-like permease
MSAKLFKGYFLSSSYMLVNFANKYLARQTTGLPPHILLSARFAFAFICLSPLFLRKDAEEILTTKSVKVQLLRAISISLTIFLTYVGYKSVPLGVAGALSSSEPIFVALWSIVFGYETWKSLRTLLPIVICGIVGVLLTSGKFFSGVSSAHTLGILALLGANTICSLSHYISAWLGKSNRSETTVVYNVLFVNAFMLVLNTVLGLSGNGYDLNAIKPFALPIMLLGCFSALASWLGLEVMKHIDPNTHVGIQNLSLPIAIGIGVLVEKETISLVKAGGILAIVASTWLLTYRKFNLEEISEPGSAKRKKLKRYSSALFISVVVLFLTEFSIQSRAQAKPKHSHSHCHCCC